jgi:hypothetical protein
MRIRSHAVWACWVGLCVALWGSEVCAADSVPQPEILSVAQVAGLVAQGKGDLLVHITLTVPSCPPCVTSLASVPPVVARSGWKGRFVRVQWDDWDRMG